MASATALVNGLALLTVGFVVACADGASPAGSIVYLGQFPWHGTVFNQSEETLELKNLVGSGALISHTHFITSASAVDGLLTTDLKVLVGTLTLSGLSTIALPSRAVLVATVTAHPDWNKDTAENDLAILKLDATLIESSWVSNVRLPATYFQGASYVDRTLSVTSWDRTDAANSDLYLTVDNLAVVRNRDCQAAQANPQALLPWTKLCAAAADPTLCTTDNGDPVVLLEDDGVYTLVGVLSSDTQCQTDKPSTLTRITEYLDWIKDNSNAQIES